MNNFELEKLSVILEWEYKNYLCHGDVKSLLNVVQSFFIPIDIERLDDYEIKKLDTRSLEFEMLDKKSNTLYVSTCSKDERQSWPGYNIDVLETSGDKKIARKYFSEGGILLSEKLLIDGDKSNEVDRPKMLLKKVSNI